MSLSGSVTDSLILGLQKLNLSRRIFALLRQIVEYYFLIRVEILTHHLNLAELQSQKSSQNFVFVFKLSISNWISSS